jgi:hypothetical protein
VLTWRTSEEEPVMLPFQDKGGAALAPIPQKRNLECIQASGGQPPASKISEDECCDDGLRPAHFAVACILIGRDFRRVIATRLGADGGRHPRTSDPLGKPREMIEPESLGG